MFIHTVSIFSTGSKQPLNLHKRLRTAYENKKDQNHPYIPLNSCIYTLSKTYPTIRKFPPIKRTQQLANPLNFSGKSILYERRI